MRYFKARWDERTPGPAESWGGSWWLFELGADRRPLRQVMVFDNGKRLRYDKARGADDFGGLGADPLDPADGYLQGATRDEFEGCWQAEAENG